ncbi:MAG: class I SAM-dependent methyltransferase [Myxococcota bacterium]
MASTWSFFVNQLKNFQLELLRRASRPLLEETLAEKNEIPEYSGLAPIWTKVADGWPTLYPSTFKHLRTTGFKPTSMLDLACGTGRGTRFAVECWKTIVKVFGVDSSPDMLSHFREFPELNVQLQCADMRSFRIESPVQLAICIGDSMNYLPTIEDVGAVLKNVSASLEPGGYFLFDFEARRSMERLDRTITHVGPYVIAYTWDVENEVCTGHTLFDNAVERHTRYAYEPDTVTQLASRYDFEVMETLSDKTWDYFALRKLR